MRILIDANATQVELAKNELGNEFPVGQLLTPLTRYRDLGLTYAIDNGAFSGFDAPSFVSLLARQRLSRDRCLFVAVPDVVGNARRTLEVFSQWYGRLSGWPLALVIQDGIGELPIPWDLIEAVFVGGTTEFKLSDESSHVVLAAKAIGKWVHVGRVNTPQRIAHFARLGVDSIDGTGLSRYSWMRKAIRGCEAADQPELFPESDRDIVNDIGGNGKSVV